MFFRIIYLKLLLRVGLINFTCNIFIKNRNQVLTDVNKQTLQEI